ncbi:MAG TPA: acyltransferase [Mycobacteriales bacterium]|nr:acyltransferase [Mycobacteriales bacterium]
MSADGYFAHPTAEIDEGAGIGSGAQLWHWAHVRAGASIGAETRLGGNVYVDANVHIGDRVKIQNNVSVYQGVTIEDDVFVGPAVVFTNDRAPRAFGQWEIVPTVVRRGASIGANATIVCGLELGEFSMVGAGAVARRSVRPHELVAGNPARHLGWVCRCGRVTSRDEEQPLRLACGDCDWDQT